MIRTLLYLPVLLLTFIFGSPIEAEEEFPGYPYSELSVGYREGEQETSEFIYKSKAYEVNVRSHLFDLEYFIPLSIITHGSFSIGQWTLDEFDEVEDFEFGNHPNTLGGSLGGGLVLHALERFDIVLGMDYGIASAEWLGFKDIQDIDSQDDIDDVVTSIFGIDVYSAPYLWVNAEIMKYIYLSSKYQRVFPSNVGEVDRFVNSIVFVTNSPAILNVGVELGWVTVSSGYSGFNLKISLSPARG